MLRNIFIFLFIFSTGLFAWRPKPPINLKVEAQEPAGFENPLQVTVTVELIKDIAERYGGAVDIELKIFLPPAMRLEQGPLYWKGVLELGESKVIHLVVQPTLNKPLIYDIGAVVKSSVLRWPLTDRCSIFLESNRGAVLDALSMYQTLEKKPWLKKALGFETLIILDDNGFERTVTVPVVDRLQSQSDLDTKTLQEARPNKLYQKEWLEYLSPPEKLGPESHIEIEPKKKKVKSAPKLAEEQDTHYGYVRNSVKYLKGVWVQWVDRVTRERLGTVYTNSNGRFEFTETAGRSLRLQVRLKTEKGDEVKELWHDWVPYSIMDYTYEEIEDNLYYWGIINYDDGPGDYDEAGNCFYELELIGFRTRVWNQYDVTACECRYPVDLPGATGRYLLGQNIMEIVENEWNTVPHEFGHHIHDNKGVSFEGYDPYYGWGCSTQDLTNKVTAYVEGWAESYLEWRFSDSSESDYCYIRTLELVFKNKAAHWDLWDYGRDGEFCMLYMSEIIAGFRSNEDDILEYLNRLKTLYPGDAAEIDSVIDVNTLYDETLLLASAGNPADLPAKVVETDLLQNEPNPFNPSTTISFTLGGKESIKLDLTVFDIRGRTVKRLISGSREPGKHTVFWDGTNEFGGLVSSGVYFYRLTAGDFTRTRKLVILK